MAKKFSTYIKILEDQGVDDLNNSVKNDFTYILKEFAAWRDMSDLEKKQRLQANTGKPVSDADLQAAEAPANYTPQQRAETMTRTGSDPGADGSKIPTPSVPQPAVPQPTVQQRDQQPVGTPTADVGTQPEPVVPVAEPAEVPVTNTSATEIPAPAVPSTQQPVGGGEAPRVAKPGFMDRFKAASKNVYTHLGGNSSGPEEIFKDPVTALQSAGVAADSKTMVNIEDLERLFGGTGRSVPVNKPTDGTLTDQLMTKHTPIQEGIMDKIGRGIKKAGEVATGASKVLNNVHRATGGRDGTGGTDMANLAAGKMASSSPGYKQLITKMTTFLTASDPTTHARALQDLQNDTAWKDFMSTATDAEKQNFIAALKQFAS